MKDLYSIEGILEHITQKTGRRMMDVFIDLSNYILLEQRAHPNKDKIKIAREYCVKFYNKQIIYSEFYGMTVAE